MWNLQWLLANSPSESMSQHSFCPGPQWFSASFWGNSSSGNMISSSGFSYSTWNPQQLLLPESYSGLLGSLLCLQTLTGARSVCSWAAIITASASIIQFNTFLQHQQRKYGVSLSPQFLPQTLLSGRGNTNDYLARKISKFQPTLSGTIDCILVLMVACSLK